MNDLHSFAKELKATYVIKDNILTDKLTNSKDTADFLMKIFPVELDQKEAFICLYLNRANQIIGYSVIGIGGISGTAADPKIVFQNALLANASSIVLSHNHPSGNLKPSEMDIELTEKMVGAAKLLDMTVVDHVIITEGNYYSFADNGRI